MKKYIIVSILFSSFVLFSQGNKPKMTPEEYGRLMKKGIEQRRISFDISGTVVDAKGHLLDKVNMTVAKSKSIWFDKYEDSKQTKLISGTFRIKTKKQDVITLSFEKDGYYNVSNMGIHTGKDKNKIKNGVLEVKDLKIVMRKIGKLADLLDYEGVLRFSPDGKATVLSLKQKTNKDGDVIKHEKSENYKEVEDSEELLQVKNIFKQDALPENCIYAIADSDKSGRIKTKLFNDDYYSPEAIRLYFSTVLDDESGFIIYKPHEERVKLIWRNMIKAPEKGYQKELVIGVKKMNEIFAQGQDLYFYFKAGEKYGKGCISNIEYRGKEGVFRQGDESIDQKGNGTLEIGVECRLNPDGTRNLESLN